MKKLFCVILLICLLTANVSQSQSVGMFGQMLNLGHWSTDGLVFYWRGIPAGKAVDESYSRNDGTIGSAFVWESDRLVGPGYSNANGYINLGDGIDPRTWEGITVIIFADFIAAAAGEFPGIISNVPVGDDFGQFLLTLTQDNGGLFWRPGDNSTALLSVSTDWYGEHMITATWVKQGLASLYRDGRLIVSANKTNSWQAGNNDTNINGYFRSIHRTSAHRYKTIFIYNRVLSVSELQQLYINPNLPMQRDPIWLFYSPGEPPSGIIPIIQAHARRRRAG